VVTGGIEGASREALVINSSSDLMKESSKRVCVVADNDLPGSFLKAAIIRLHFPRPISGAMRDLLPWHLSSLKQRLRKPSRRSTLHSKTRGRNDISMRGRRCV
jgi:hypothetical protein